MSDRRHVWHDPAYPPDEIVSGYGARGKRELKPSTRLRMTGWVVLWVLLGACLLGVVVFFGAAAFVGILDAADDPMLAAPVTEAEEKAVLGLAATIADRGRRGDFEAIMGLAEESAFVDRSELSSDLAQAFGGPAVKDWNIDYENSQVLKDVKTRQRIIVFRLALVEADDRYRYTSPLYAIRVGDAWRLTGIRGRTVEDVLY